MVGLLISIVLFNIIAFKNNKVLTLNQLIHIWMFTIAFETMFDYMVEGKYELYWYFTKEADWADLLAYTFLVPPVNMLFLNLYPYRASFAVKFFYMMMFVVGILFYELFALLPEPLGYFYYGKWSIFYSVLIDPILLFILLKYYQFVVSIEEKIKRT